MRELSGADRPGVPDDLCRDRSAERSAPDWKPSRAACLDAVFGHLLAAQAISDYLADAHLAAAVTYALDVALDLEGGRNGGDARPSRS